MDFRNYKDHKSDHIAKAKLREELEEAMKKYKGKITVLDNRPTQKKINPIAELRLRLRDEILHRSKEKSIKEQAEEMGVGLSLLHRITKTEISVKKKSLFAVAKRMGFDV